MKKILLLSVLAFSCSQEYAPNLVAVPGPKGDTGSAGTNCSVSSLATGSVAAPNGGSLITCQDGTNSLVLNGTNGTNGTVIKAVQFCAGTPTYPSTFPEIGFQIDGVLYAVYSIPNAFLAVIPPGTYSSNGINSSCSFTVNNDGSITRL